MSNPILALNRFVGIKFLMEIQQIQVAYFTECTGLQVSTSPFKFNEGGLNSYGHQLPTAYSIGDITLKYGVMLGDDLWKWFEKVLNGNIERRDVSLYLFENKGVVKAEPKVTWHLHQALPTKYVGPHFNVTGGGEVACDSLTLVCEGLTRV
jgi:phage tail-like protein